MNLRRLGLTASIVSLPVLVAVASALASAPAHVALPSRAPLVAAPLAAHPHRIIVKFGARVSECAHCLLARTSRFASVTGSDSLDRLNQRFHALGAHGLFLDDHSHGTMRAQASARRFDDVRRRYPERSTRVGGGVHEPDLSNIFVVELGEGVDPSEAAAAYGADPDVEYAEPDYRVHAALTPDDPFWSSTGNVYQGVPDLWGLHTVGADAAWDVSNGSGKVVAIVDTGINVRHADIAANMWTNPGEIARNHVDDDDNGFVDDVYGWDFTRDKPASRDRHGHGTHVAGTVAATGNNGTGVIGLAYGAHVLSAQGLNARGFGYESDLVKGIVYATENGADVVNNSWGGGGGSSALRDAVATATSLGVVVVFAAGNESSQYLGPAATPGVIAVAATDIGDVPASFSNYGPSISVSAPGAHILSLRGANRVVGDVVAGRYRVLSGTSMAAPHVSALAALVLDSDPSLTTDELRWHLELGADQPGIPGYESEPWNPRFGWGRINAANAFDAPPVTTRIATAPLAMHALAGTAVANATTLDFSFTTLDPVAWSIASPSFLVPESAAGSGPASVPLTLDLTSSPVGPYDGTITLSAPAAVDGGDSVDASVYAHEDVRSGGLVTVTDEAKFWGLTAPATASDGNGVLTAWVQLTDTISLMGAYIDDAGNVTGPFPISVGPCDFFCAKKEPGTVAVAYDGNNFVVAWAESLEAFVNEISLKTRNTTRVLTVRVSSAGAVLDAQPTELAVDVENENSYGGFDRYFTDMGVAFDGTRTTVVWSILDFGPTQRPLEVFMAQVGTNGAQIGQTASIYPIDGEDYHNIRPYLACVTGSCLLAWVQADGETNPYGKYIHKLFGMRFVGMTRQGPPYRLSTDVNWISAIAASPTGYLIAGWRYNRPDYDVNGNDVVFARVAANGTPLDPDTVRVNNTPAPEGLPYSVIPTSAVYDGESYVVTWGELGPPSSYPLCYPFAARIGTDGIVETTEPEGLLLAEVPNAQCGMPVLQPTATKSLLVWHDWDYDYTHPSYVFAQGVLER
jgi:hypothetical protein